MSDFKLGILEYVFAFWPARGCGVSGIMAVGMMFLAGRTVRATLWCDHLC